MVGENWDLEREAIVGVGQYSLNRDMHTAEVALVVRDDYQGKDVGTELLHRLTYLAKRQGLLGFSAEVLSSNSRCGASSRRWASTSRRGERRGSTS